MIVDTFLKSLKNAPKHAVYNPWYDRDHDHDVVGDTPAIRRGHLRHYLEQRLEKARYLLVAEAVGYQGAHFSGVAMTSERILLGHMRDRHIAPEDVFTGLTPQRTSHPEIRARGFTEPTATIVWGAMHDLGVDPYHFVLWNIFPWHPYNPDRGLLTNRTPTRDELAQGLTMAREFFRLFPQRPVLAIGQKSADQLAAADMDYFQARHPANGGATKFRRHVQDFIRQIRP